MLHGDMDNDVVINIVHIQTSPRGYEPSTCTPFRPHMYMLQEKRRLEVPRHMSSSRLPMSFSSHLMERERWNNKIVTDLLSLQHFREKEIVKKNSFTTKRKLGFVDGGPSSGRLNLDNLAISIFHEKERKGNVCCTVLERRDNIQDISYPLIAIDLMDYDKLTDR